MHILYGLAALAAAASADSVSIYTESKKYSYLGCYNETTEIPESSKTRALDGGINEVKKGEMTVPMCLSFCADGKTQYRYAGLEWSRECWCSQSISGISEKLDDNQCSFACEGNSSMACGGSLKLSVYKISAASQLSSAPAALVVSGALLAWMHS